MPVAYPSSNAVDLMTAISAGLPNATIHIANSQGGTDFPVESSSPGRLSSSPSYQLPNGTIIVMGSTVGYYYNGNTGTVNGGTINFGNLTGIPVVNGPNAILVTDQVNNLVYLVGAVIPPPIGNPTMSNY